ncbi:MAG: ATP-binding protein [Pseudomonadota bacterium]
MRRPPLIRWRIGVIVVIGLLAMGSIPIALFYATSGADRVAAIPQPGQLAAIADLVESAPPPDRTRLFEALRSAQMSIRVASEATVEADLAPLWPDGDSEIADYRAALEGRAFAAYAVPRKLFARGIFSPLSAAEFRVDLRNGGVLIVASEHMAMFTNDGMPIGLPGALIGALVAFVALILLNREFKPVWRLAKAVDALDPSDPDARLPEIRAGTFEVRLLIAAFNRQQERVGTLLRGRAALVGGIQHDVRTFATRLRLRTEKLANPEDRQQAEADVSDLVSLMDGALLATRSEAGRLDLELLDMRDLLKAEVRDRQATGAKTDLTVSTSAEDAQVIGDRLALRRIVSNIVENALRYGAAAHITLDADAETVILTVDDDGPGIPEDQRAYLLEPFARQETSRSRQTGGAGLGLAIVSSLLDGHQGIMSIGDAPGGGARIAIRLPRFHAEE